ncbi:MAG: (Fe-S)-binding protein, partial [Dehalococcoidales bacterium]|nr:(Fe-S)-binding protein [Dehalococcoidales bacterium]
MKKTQPLKITDISRRGEDTLSIIRPDGLIPLPPPYDRAEALPPVTELTPDQKSRLASDLDGFCALALLRSTAGQKETVERFIAGVSKLLSKDDNWTFLQPLLLSLDHCARCQTCSDACHVYLASGKNELYRPIYRSEVFRRIVNKYARPAGGLLSKLRGDIELNFTVISRLYELAYRCNLCRRCAQACPMGVDNALITREIRKLFSQELGWAPQELHEKGTVLQLTAGSPTGMRPGVAVDNMRFLEEEFGEATGINFTVPWDRTGAEVLFIPSAGDIISNPEGVIAIAILAEGAGISWTLSSEISGYEATNY